MKLLILTQKVDKNDSLLGFFHRWIEEFAKHCEQVTVVCLEEGAHELPNNVKVFSLGKEKLEIGNWKLEIFKKLIYIFNFYKHIWTLRGDYDHVFVHMNREYILLGGLLWRMLGKKIALWWVHFETPLPLRIAEKLSHLIFTASKESFQLESKKTRIVGHGIDVARFHRAHVPEIHDPIRFLYVGKITPIKNVDVFLKAAELLKNSWDRAFVIILVGPTATEEDRQYKKELEHFIKERGLGGRVHFKGSVSYQEIHNEYLGSDVVVNLCPTGGIDKMVVEGMAAGCITIVANETFRLVFGPHADDLIYPYQNAEILAEKIKALFKKNSTELDELRRFLIKQSDKHSLENLIGKIVGIMSV